MKGSYDLLSLLYYQTGHNSGPKSGGNMEGGNLPVAQNVVLLLLCYMLVQKWLISNVWLLFSQLDANAQSSKYSKPGELAMSLNCYVGLQMLRDKGSQTQFFLAVPFQCLLLGNSTITGYVCSCLCLIDCYTYCRQALPGTLLLLPLVLQLVRSVFKGGIFCNLYICQLVVLVICIADNGDGSCVNYCSSWTVAYVRSWLCLCGWFLNEAHFVC